MNILKKISFLIILLVITLVSYSLPNVEEFTKMCRSTYQKEFAKELASMLYTANKTTRLIWMSKFNHQFNSPIVYAVFNKNIPIIKVMIEISLQDNISYYKLTTRDGISMLTLAASMNQVEIIKLLLNNGNQLSMDISYKTSSALHEMAKCGSIHICKLLAETKNGRHLLHAKDYKQKTPINYLMERKEEFFVLRLLNYMPLDINNVPLDSKGMNYLHYAIIYDLNFVVRKLLQQGINPYQESFSKIAPIDLYPLYFKTTFYII
jgi:ankyrin repeat protein